jgi:uncharacterized protein YkwD
MGVVIRSRTARCRSVFAAAALAAGLAPASAALADPFAAINALRHDGCEGEPAPGTSVRPNLMLDDVARELSHDGRLEAALERIGYPAKSSTSFHVRGSSEDAAIKRLLSKRFCASVLDPRYDEAGYYRTGSEAWIVLAVRRVKRPPLQPVLVAERVLELVNAARARPRDCGRERFEATDPLTLSRRLNDAALRHARDMAERGVLSHEGSDGSQSGERITRAGYTWRAEGENVAAGQRDAQAVVAAWLESPGHCATLMGPYFTEMGIAFALAPEKNPAIYWSQEFAAPKR